jgi:hypothetical protein
VLTGVGWIAILRYGWLPANIGTFVMLFMFMAFIPGATFPGVFAGFLVQKIFFTIASLFVSLYLFLTVPGSFDREFGGATDRPVLVLSIVALGAVLVVVLGRNLLAKGEADVGERRRWAGECSRARASTWPRLRSPPSWAAARSSASPQSSCPATASPSPSTT